MASQKKALVNGLAHIVEFLDNSEHLTDYLRKMGGRHVAYGTEPEHFKWVGESFLATLAYFFDEQWTDELATSWITAFGVIAAEMKIGMDQEKNKVTELRSVESTQAVTPAAAAPPADLGTVARNLADDLLKRTVDSLVASPEFQSLVKQRAMEALHQAVELEAKQMIEVYKTNVA
jgi:hypothetical protein